MNPAEFERYLQEALSLELHYADRVHRRLSEFSNSTVKPAAVLVLFGYSHSHSVLDGGTCKSSFKLSLNPSLLYTRRTDLVEDHKGQISFPGGHTEPEEIDQPEVTALRETEEEVGIPRDIVKLVGRLPQLYTATGYLIQPFVGVLKPPVKDVALTLDPRETAEAIWAPLESLLSPGTYQSESFRVGNVDYPIDVYQYRHHRIWGATGSMTKNLLDRLNQVGLC